MMRIVRSEWVKLRTTRMWWGLALGTVAVVALNVIPAAFFAGQSFGEGVPTSPPLDDTAGLTAVYGAGYQSGYLMALVIGVIIGAVDNRFRTATQTFLATPRRGRVIVAKMVVGAGIGLLYGVVAQLATVAIAAPVIAGRGYSSGLGTDAVVRSLLLGVPGVAVWGVIGVALGVLLRNQIAAILIAVFYVFVGDFLLSGAFSLLDLQNVGKFTPNNASTAVVEGFTAFPLLSWWAGLLVLLAYGAIIAAGGWVIGRRRDIT